MIKKIALIFILFFLCLRFIIAVVIIGSWISEGYMGQWLLIQSVAIVLLFEVLIDTLSGLFLVPMLVSKSEVKSNG